MKKMTNPFIGSDNVGGLYENKKNWRELEF